MDPPQDHYVDIFGAFEYSQEDEQRLGTASPGFSGITEDAKTRKYLHALKECPDIWTKILSQKQTRRDNPGWEQIRRTCNLSSIDATRKYFDSVKKDIVRRIDIAISKRIISEDKLEVDGLDKLRESQNKYLYWDDAEYLAKHVILKRLNFDLDNRPTRTNPDLSIGVIKSETPEDQHQEPDTFSPHSTPNEEDEENSCLIEITEVFSSICGIQSTKQEKPSDDSQMPAGPSSLENSAGSSSSAISQDARTLIEIKNEPADIDDDRNNQTGTRLIMSGIGLLDDSEDLPNSMEWEDEDIEMNNVETDVGTSSEEMSRSYANFSKRISVLPTEMQMRIHPQFAIYGYKMNTLASQGRTWEQILHELRTFKL